MRGDSDEREAKRWRQEERSGFALVVRVRVVVDVVVLARCSMAEQGRGRCEVHRPPTDRETESLPLDLLGASRKRRLGMPASVGVYLPYKASYLKVPRVDRREVRVISGPSQRKVPLMYLDRFSPTSLYTPHPGTLVHFSTV